MGERNNGYGSCGELRRTGRTQGAYRQDGGCRRTGNDNDCGICCLFGGNDARDGERYGERYGERAGCGCSQQRMGANTRENRRDEGGCTCSQQRTRVDARENRRAENGCGCGCGAASDTRALGSCVKGECHALMSKLQRLDFAIQETVLYLDAYPEGKRQTSFHVFEGIGHKEDLAYPTKEVLDFVFGAALPKELDAVDPFLFGDGQD